ncbi:MAG: hypothetical protein MZV63_46020 [Marinilabiliales bacterium]|nr:hypothetical protein [Marinilabiliales bacterium]
MVMIAQMAFLAGVQEHQGIVMGLFSTTELPWHGAPLPAAYAALIAEGLGFPMAFISAAFLALTVAATIGLCLQCPGMVAVKRGTRAMNGC